MDRVCVRASSSNNHTLFDRNTSFLPLRSPSSCSAKNENAKKKKLHRLPSSSVSRSVVKCFLKCLMSTSTQLAFYGMLWSELTCDHIIYLYFMTFNVRPKRSIPPCSVGQIKLTKSHSRLRIVANHLFILVTAGRNHVLCMLSVCRSSETPHQTQARARRSI